MANVYFIGGGPYDTSLLTVKASQILQRADCILYDQLLDHTMLEGFDAECIYVGKQAGYHAIPQVEINKLLIEKAKQYDCVVRLKGGDSFVFGRGGEEAMALHLEHIPFYFIPGISSCIAVAEMAGIPLTHRGIASGFLVLSAHLQEDAWHVDTKQLENPKITLVFLMGLSKISMIVDNLKEAKRCLKTPIAIISQGASPHQTVVVSTLEGIEEAYAKQPIPTPAVVVVGDVVTLREKLAFYEIQPLFSKSILVTKINKESSPICKLLTAKGALVEELQVGEIQYLKEYEHSSKWKNYDAILFTSRHAIHAFFNILTLEQLDARSLANIKFYVIAKKCAEVLANYGIRCDAIGAGSRASLLSLLKAKLKKGERILYMKAKNADSMTILMNDTKVSLDTMDLYENKEVNIHHEDKHYDAICFSCASSVERFPHDVSTSVCVSIGPSTSSALQVKGAYRIIEASHANYEGMVEALESEVGTHV